MKKEHKRYILENLKRVSAEEIARHLNVRERHVRKFIEQEKVHEKLPPIQNPSVTPTQKKNVILCVIIIALACLMAYGNVLNGHFIWDDERLVQNNPYIKDWGMFADIFKNTLRTTSAMATTSFRPLQTLTYLVDYSIWQLNPFGYHLTNVFFHIFTALALFWLIQILFRNKLLSFLTALLFALHPVHTEAVAYISGRADPMAGFFMILSFCLYLNNTRKFTSFGMALMCLSFLMALLSRENALILPVLIIFYHYIFKKPISKRIMVGILCSAAIYILWRWLIFRGLTPEVSAPITLGERAPGIFIALTNYIRLLLVPFALHMEYGGTLFYWNEPKIYIGFILLLGLLFFAFKKRENKLVIFSIGWFLITLFPLSNIFTLNAYMAEHWLYLPSMGYALLVAGFITSLYSRKNNWRMCAVMLSIGLMAYYGGMTVYQNSFWRDPFRFYKRMLVFNPESTRLYTNLAAEYLKAGREGEVIPLLKTAIAIDPDNATAYNNLGIAYSRTGAYDKAMRSYEKAMAVEPQYAMSYYNAGIVYADMMDNLDRAIPLLIKALKRDPQLYRGYLKLGLLYLKQGKEEEAIAILKEAIRTNPGMPEGYHELSSIYFRQGRHGLAIDHYDRAAALGYVDPLLVEALKPYR